MPIRSRKNTRDLQDHHRKLFWGRFAQGAVAAGILILGSLLLGVLGYHFIADLEWIEAILNASMILTGMGPVTSLTTNGGKLFAAFYALFSGLAFVTASGILLTPMLQHVLQLFHIEQKNSRGD